MTNTQRVVASSLGFVTLLAAGLARAQAPAPAAAAPPPAYAPPGAYDQQQPYQQQPYQGYGAYPPPAAYPPATTNYQVLYPQRRGALPPGMELPYHEGDPIPDGYRLVTRPRTGLIRGGLLTMGIPWALSVSIAAGVNWDNKSGYLLVPGLGPWLMLLAGGASPQCTNSTSDYCVDTSGALRTLLVMDGIVQTAGLVMLASGLYFPSRRLIRNDVTVSMMPSRVGADGYGLGLHGTF